MTDTRIDALAEQLLREVSAAITTPEGGECLQCFVARMLDAFGCDGTLRFARRYRDLRAPTDGGLEQVLAAVGSRCDCEIFLHGWWFTQPENVSPATALPICGHVGAGTTHACSQWERRR